MILNRIKLIIIRKEKENIHIINIYLSYYENISVTKSKDQWRSYFKQLSQNEETQNGQQNVAGMGKGNVVYGRDKQRDTKNNLHLNLSMIFPPHNVAKAILTANTEILPWPSLFNDKRKRKKKKMSFGEFTVMKSDIFCSVEIIGHCSCIHYVNTSTLENTMNTIQYKFLKSCLVNVSFFQEIAGSSSYSLYMSLAQSMN